MLSVAIAYFIHMTGLDLAWCFLIVFVLYLLRRRAAGLRRPAQGQAGQGPGAGHPPGAGDQEHPQAWLTAVGGTHPDGRPSRDTGALAAPTRRCQRGPVPRRGGGAGRRAAGAAAARVPRVLVDLAPPAPALARAGYRAVAMDLRGYGGSDKTPNGYDPITLAQDVSGVVKALGAREAVWSGTAGAGTSAGRPPRCTRARCRPCAPWPHRTRVPCSAALRPGGGSVAPAARARDAGADAPRAAARPARQRLPRAAPALLERPRLGVPADGGRGDVPAGDRAVAGLALRAGVPPLAGPVPGRARTAGASAPRCAPPPGAAGAAASPAPTTRRARPGRRALPRGASSGELTDHRMPGVGHFPHEEDPAGFTALLLRLAGGLPAPRSRPSGAVAGVDRVRRGSGPAAAASRDLLGGQRVAGVARR